MLKVLERPQSNGKRNPKLKTEVQTITPDIAKAYLDRNFKNRKHSKMTVLAYARDMKAGKWALTGDPLQFDVDGNLLNGQHRLMACVEADTAFETMVVHGLLATAQDRIDTGKPRGMADVLTMNGFHNAHLVASIARIVYAQRHGFFYSNSVKPTHSELAEIIKKHKGIAHSAREVMNVVALPKSVAGYVHYVGCHVLDFPAIADAYINVLKTGVPSYEGCPVHRLRERLLRQQDKTRLPRSEVMKAAMHAWNLFAEEKSVSVLKWYAQVEIKGLNIKKL